MSEEKKVQKPEVLFETEDCSQLQQKAIFTKQWLQSFKGKSKKELGEEFDKILSGNKN